jgi:hypothetical protein
MRLGNFQPAKVGIFQPAETGEYSTGVDKEMASRLHVLPCTVKKWRDKGLLRALRYNDKGECLYESPDVLLPRKGAHKRSYLAAREVVMHNPDEVQCEA